MGPSISSEQIPTSSTQDKNYFIPLNQYSQINTLLMAASPGTCYDAYWKIISINSSQANYVEIYDWQLDEANATAGSFVYSQKCDPFL